MAGMQLAQINVATAREPLHSPLLAAFVGALDEVNALWESADALWDFFPSGDHLAVMRRRR
jgi:hypothetical protein